MAVAIRRSPVASSAPAPGRSLLFRLAPVLFAAALLAVWQVLSLAYPPFILPSPAEVASRFVERTVDGTLPRHVLITLSEAAPGLLFGLLLGLAAGLPVAKSALADRMLSPLLVASQGIPFVAVAPLIFIWFGNGWVAKVLVCTLIVFFPIAINVIAGVRSVPHGLRDLFRMHRATPLQTLRLLELPHALPHIFTGLRTGAALSMIGALTGEFISADRGLGFLINQANGAFDTPLVMAAIAATVITALGIFQTVRWIERFAVRLPNT
jgi:NitT/TauT family transport system permease protein